MLLTGVLPVSVEFRPVTGGLPVSGIETYSVSTWHKRAAKRYSQKQIRQKD